MRSQAFKSMLYEMTQTTPTALWNDSCAIQELSASIEDNGAVGATCNPAIVLTVLKQEWAEWKVWILQIARENPTATEDELAWMLVEEMSRKAATLLEQAVRFHGLAPNMIVKIPVTAAGVLANEEATWLGVSINATASFTLPQAIAADLAAIVRDLILPNPDGAAP